MFEYGKDGWKREAKGERFSRNGKWMNVGVENSRTCDPINGDQIKKIQWLYMEKIDDGNVEKT